MGGGKEGGLWEEKYMIRMKISNSFFLEFWFREVIFCFVIIGVYYSYLKCNLKWKIFELDLFFFFCFVINEVVFNFIIIEIYN